MFNIFTVLENVMCVIPSKQGNTNISISQSFQCCSTVVCLPGNRIIVHTVPKLMSGGPWLIVLISIQCACLIPLCITICQHRK